MDRRKQTRPPAMLLTFVLTLILMTGIWIVVNGKAANQAFAMQRQFVAEQVRFAVESLKKGDQGAADKAIQDAIQVQGGNSSAVVAVTEELLRLDRPDYAAFVLCDENGRVNACKRPELNWDPMLWATLARARARAGNDKEVKPAMEEAERRAEALVKDIEKKTAPVQNSRPTPEQQQEIFRLMEAGMYFGNFQRVPEKAIAVMREAHRIWPDQIETQNAYGYTLVDLGATPEEIDEGLLLTQRAAKAAPESGIIRDSYGWGLFRKGDLIGARRVLREAVDLEPNIPEIHFHLGLVYAELKLRKEAEIELNRALELRPIFPQAQAAKAALAKLPATP